VALPIFERIMQAVWAQGTPRTALVGPSREAARHLVALPIDVRSGEQLGTRGGGAFVEYFRLGPNGRLTETQYRLVSRGSEYGNSFGPPPFGLPWFFGGSGYQRDYDGSPFQRQAPQSRSEWGPENDPRYLREPQLPPPQYDPRYEERPRTLRPRRAEPEFFWRRRQGF
jgi:hypothetical protein